MQMQKSLVSIDGQSGQLRLSGPLSEWLFSSRFWADFNAEHGTIFDQFEEDVADPLVVKAVIGALEERARVLQEVDKHYVQFTYRWTAEHVPLIVNVPRDSLLSELIVFRDFLADAVAKNRDVMFSL